MKIHRYQRILSTTLVVAGASALITPSARADITSVTVNSSGPYSAQHYTLAEVVMHGTVSRSDGSTGSYAVPLVLLYPAEHRSNSIGVVEWLNTSSYHGDPMNPPPAPPPDESLTLPFATLAMGNFMVDEGYTIATVQWDKAVTDTFGATPPNDGQPHNHLVFGSIDRAGDAFEILRDAGRLLKDPSSYPGSNGPSEVDFVVASGYSQTAALQMSFLSQAQAAGVYDGHLIGSSGLSCLNIDETPPFFGSLGPCAGFPVAGSAKVVSVQTETDVALLGAFFSRNPGDPNWVQYELPGVAHIPGSLIPLPGVPEQNPVDSSPVYRGSLDNLAEWIKDNEDPPPPAYVDGAPDENGFFVPQVDSDGNWLGGLRLPHMEDNSGCRPAGAPLGVYSGVNFGSTVPFAAFGGTFTPFDAQELENRYPTHGSYVGRVARSARRLFRHGYIVRADKRAYIVNAAQTQF